MKFRDIATVAVAVTVLMRVCEQKEAAGVFRKLPNEKLRNLLSSPNADITSIKAIPLQAWTGPEGSRRLRVPDFKTIGT